MTPSPELQAALSELQEASLRPYYDESGDAADRDAYYAGIDLTLSGADLFARLSALLTQTHANRLRYKPALHVYPWLDLQKNRKLASIYSGREYDPAALIQEDFRVDERRERLREAMGIGSEAADLDLLEAQIPYNCEHVVPQSWFGKDEPMRGDLHHLFACESGCNSFRGNIPFFDFADFEAERSECGRRLDTRFEPEHGKGAVARATLYFVLRYPGEINRTAQEYTEERLATLLLWHARDPISEYERHRNAVARAKQGNRNPLIDFPGLADRISFALGLG